MIRAVNRAASRQLLLFYIFRKVDFVFNLFKTGFFFFQYEIFFAKKLNTQYCTHISVYEILHFQSKDYGIFKDLSVVVCQGE